MNRRKRNQRKPSPQRLRAAIAGTLFGVAVTAPVNAEIAQTPLIVSDAAEANLIVAIDDSGSMDSEVLFPTNDGAAWWNTKNDSFYGLGRNNEAAERLNFNENGGSNGTWQKYIYLFPNGTGNGNRLQNDASNDHFAIPPTPEFAWARSPAFNNVYFDPRKTYEPWVSNGTQTFSDVDPTAAPSDPTRGSSTVDLTGVIASTDSEWTFRMYDDMELSGGTVFNQAGDDDANRFFDDEAEVLANGDDWEEAGADGETISSNNENVGIAYRPAQFFVPADTVLPSPYDEYKESEIGEGSGPDGEELDGYVIRSENFDSDAAYSEAIQNFANWFTYHRKRHLATRAGIGAGFDELFGLRVGQFTINNRNNVDMINLANGDDREDFYDEVYSIGPGGGTPNKQALKHAGEQFKRTDDNAPINLECQSNATLLFTDGYSNQWNGAGVGNVDGGRGEPFEDDASDTMADIAMAYYDGDKVPLRSGADFPSGQVPTPNDCPDDQVDCVSDLHMQTFGIVMGAVGNIFGQDAAATEDPFANPPEWPEDFPTRNPAAVDDLWHATVNTRADMIDARDSQALAEAFRAIASSVRQSTASSAAVASNSTRLDTDTRIYQARFNSRRWSGELLAFDIDSDTGDIASSPAWNAAEEMPGPNARDIYSYNDVADDGFEWPTSTVDSAVTDFTVAQADALNSEDGEGTARLAWLRGDSSEEQRNGGDFRDRELLPGGDSNPLGDIVNSDPILVADQDFGFTSLPDSDAAAAYTTFKRDVKRDRPATIYVGANDGMLHAFDADSGEERFAFVPSGIYDNLSKLTDPDYEHRFFVDGSPRVMDAYIDTGDGKEWRTILVGTTAAGGSSVFALDITNPESFDESNILWEINDDTLQADTSDERLGKTFGKPNVVRLEDGQWAAVFGNGYDTPSDKAKLFVVDLASGDVLKTIDTEAGSSSDPNGLSAALTIDIDADKVTERAYAGDLQGNLWRFDLDGKENNWEVAFKAKGSPAPLFVARSEDPDDGERRPITVRPAGAFNPDGDLMIFFGTGKLFETGDNEVGEDPSSNSFFGIKDLDSTIDPDSLVEQEIDKEVASGGERFRITESNDVAASDHGWYMPFESPEEGLQGERIIEPAVISRGDDPADTRLVFPTAIPESDPCSFGGDGWLMDLQAWSGKSVDEAIFDTNNDGDIDDGDSLDGDDQGTGLAMGDIVTTPSIIRSGTETQLNFMSGVSGNLYKVESRGPAVMGLGRSSWRELR